MTRWTPAQVDHVVGEVTIPPHVTPERVTTHIIDSSCTRTTQGGPLSQ